MPSAPHERYYKRVNSLIVRLFHTFLYLSAYAFTLPYGFFYYQNTRRPLKNIAASSNPAECRDQVELFLKAKLREAQYVQVAGTVVFGATIACLLWSTPLQKAHYSGPALWYAGIVLSLTAIVLGAQQTIYIPGSIPSTSPPRATTEIEVSEGFAREFQQHLRRRSAKSSENGGIGLGLDNDKRQPRKLMLFIWQTPLMLFTYSVCCFLAGLSSVVISPLAAEGGGWRDESKTIIIYVVAGAVGLGTFTSTSIGLNSAFGQKLRGPSSGEHIG